MVSLFSPSAPVHESAIGCTDMFTAVSIGSPIDSISCAVMISQRAVLGHVRISSSVFFACKPSFMTMAGLGVSHQVQWLVDMRTASHTEVLCTSVSYSLSSKQLQGRPLAGSPTGSVVLCCLSCILWTLTGQSRR